MSRRSKLSRSYLQHQSCESILKACSTYRLYRAHTRPSFEDQENRAEAQSAHIPAIMAPTTVQQVLLSPAELSYLHTSLSLSPPIRPDSRLPTQFRPLSAETDILPGTNGSARITFADGTEAIVGIKAEVEKSTQKYSGYSSRTEDTGHVRDDNEGRYGDNKWLEMSIEVPGFRDDDAMPVLLTSVLTEALLADSSFTRRLWINRRFHWKLYIDVSSHHLRWMSEARSLTSISGSPPLSTALIPTPSPLTYHLPRTTLHTSSTAQVREGRRSSLRRRLGCVRPTLPTLRTLNCAIHRITTGRDSLHFETTYNITRHVLRREHPLRPIERGTGSRRCRVGYFDRIPSVSIEGRRQR